MYILWKNLWNHCGQKCVKSGKFKCRSSYEKAADSSGKTGCVLPAGKIILFWEEKEEKCRNFYGLEVPALIHRPTEAVNAARSIAGYLNTKGSIRRKRVKSLSGSINWRSNIA